MTLFFASLNIGTTVLVLLFAVLIAALAADNASR